MSATAPPALDRKFNYVDDRPPKSPSPVMGYVLAILFWPGGLIYALYIATADKTASIPRHAIGVGGASLMMAAIYVTVYLVAIAPSANGANATSDLQSILDNNSIAYVSVDSCTHSTGDQYLCSVTTSDGQTTVTLTDDAIGNTYEQGLSK